VRGSGVRLVGGGARGGGGGGGGEWGNQHQINDETLRLVQRDIDLAEASIAEAEH
jgi:hypothetical protein